MLFYTRSFRLFRLKHISSYLGEKLLYAPLGLMGKEVVWGRKEDYFDPQSKHRSNKITIEDGFISYLRHPSVSKSPLSLIIDNRGIYYDCRFPSDIEMKLNSIVSRWDSEKEQRIIEAIERIKRLRISKYNHSSKLIDIPSGRNILLVDQAYNDRSVRFSGGSAASFDTMIANALAESPDSKIYLKIHPDHKLAGKKTYLERYVNHPRFQVIDESVNVWDVLENIDKVYTVSSQLGFEALLAGKKVVCLAKSFYAGWGLCQKEPKIIRRSSRPSLLQFAYVCLIEYPTYLHPISKKTGRIEDVLDYFEVFLKPHVGFFNRLYAVNFSPWKQSFIKKFLIPFYSKEIEFYTKLPKPSQVNSNEAVLVWGDSFNEDLSNWDNAKILRVEDGFIRSVGLGSDWKHPLSLCFCQGRLHYDGFEGNAFDVLANGYELSKSDLNQAKSLRLKIVRERVSKYNLTEKNLKQSKIGVKRLLVIGQVASDASLRYTSSSVTDDAKLLRKVRTQFPDAWILYKPHPDVIAGNRKAVSVDARDFDEVVGNVSLFDLFNAADSVHVMSSTAGFEALLYSKKVYTYASPFYAGWGLTEDFMSFPQRKKKLSIDELVFLALFKYPVYRVPSIDLPVGADLALDYIVAEKNHSIKSYLDSRFASRLFRKLSYLKSDYWG